MTVETEVTPVAGRKPRATQDEQAGVSPLKPSRSRPPGKGPARGYSWAPFEEGNGAAVRHGAYSESRVAERAGQIITAVLEDARMPEHVRAEAFRFALTAWARSEAMSALCWEWVCKLEEDAPGSSFVPQRGILKTPSEIWKAMESHATRMRGRVGLDQASYAAISRDLGLADKAVQGNLDRMSAAGAELIARRALQAVPAVVEGP